MGNKYNDRSKNNNSNRNYGDRNKHEMHDAVCDECGKACKVPFKPSGSKPIYCSECFEKQGNSRNDRSSKSNPYDKNSSKKWNRDDGAKSYEINNKLNELDQKLDKILQILSNVKTSQADDQSSYEFKEKKTVRGKSDEKLSLK